MHLILDIGNTNTKLAVFEANDLKAVELVEGVPDASALDGVVQRYPNVGAAILSSVVAQVDGVKEYLQRFDPWIELRPGLPLPIQNAYDTPETLGNDRLAAVIGAQTHFPGQDVLVVDLGTCITYDLLRADGTYEGGGISPGLQMRFQSVHTFTSQLPLVNRQSSAPLIGKSTEACIRSGVQHGIIQEIDGVIDRYREQFPNVQIVGTGGDFEFFEKLLKNSIFADAYLVPRGLNAILLHHAQL